ncbi:MAG: IMPACT family member YigZ [Flavobacterium sp. SCGC AAA160-P02]|nr:MAG: IMPACT family member YigZ [Flavobacterium sp. SCGC AAA160-P02]
MDDLYKTIEKPSRETLFKDRNSKFYGYAFPVSSEADIRDLLELLKKKHHSAGHFCYAWQIGIESVRFRVNDDGEPNNSAGMPIYGQIQSFGLTNILIVSVRYFGGTKLGIGGLINAYKQSAKLAIESSIIIEKTIDVLYELNFEYELISRVMKIIRENAISIQSQKFDIDCKITIVVRKSKINKVLEIFSEFYKVQIQPL